MKLRLNRQEMADALTAISSVAAARTPKETLKCVRMDAQADVLLLSATDLELGLRYAVTQVEVDEPGVTLVSAETLTKIVRECTDELLQLEMGSSVLHVRGSGSHFQIVTLDPADFPAVADIEGEPDLTMEFGALHRLIEWTSFAAARESTRYAINGVLWELDGTRLTLAATDGRRLSVARGTLGEKAPKGQTTAIVPIKTLQLFNKLPIEPDQVVGMKITANQLLIKAGGALISSSLVEGQFPNYRDVIPADCDRIATLDASEFLSALRRASLLTNEESKGVRFAFSEGTLTLSSRAPEQGEAEISISVGYKDEAMEIGFNPSFLIDILRVARAEEITIALREENRPGVIRLSEDFVYVVMPVSLSSA